jgi:hypothetical protein
MLRKKAAWPMIALFGAGSISLWTSAIIKLYTSGGFQGIISWQTLGAPLPIYRGTLTAQRALKAPSPTRKRLWTIVGIVAANVLCNGWAIFLIVHLILVGRLVWSAQDKWAFAIAGITTLSLLAGKLTGALSSDTMLFSLIVTYRALPQALLAASPDLTHISWWTFGGVGAIALQGFIVYFIEFEYAKDEFKSGEIEHGDLIKARWTLWAEACNFLSVLIPLFKKALF